MKRIISWVSVLFLSAGLLVYSGNEAKEYDSTMPGQNYFILHTNVLTSPITWTNNESFMWYPSYVKVNYGSSTNMSVTLDHVTVITRQYFEDTDIVTNEFGNIATNYVHVLTNTAYAYITNRVITITEGTNTIGTGSAVYDYVQRGDVLVWSFSVTNPSPWLTVIGRR